MNHSQLRTDVKLQLLEGIASTPSPTRRTEARGTSARVMLSVALTIAIFMWDGGLQLGGRPVLLVVLTSLGTAVLSAVGLWIALDRRGSMLGRSCEELLLYPLVLSCTILLWKIFWHDQYPYPLDVSLERGALHCLALGSTVGASPLLTLLFCRRGTDPIHPASSGTSIGAAVGLSIAVLLDLSCSASSATHLLLGHLAPVALLAVTGLGLGKAMLGPRLTAKRIAPWSAGKPPDGRRRSREHCSS